MQTEAETLSARQAPLLVATWKSEGPSLSLFLFSAFITICFSV